MRAQAGDWLVVEGPDTEHHRREGRIVEVHSSDGSPPFVVRWSDTGHDTLVFPGPDAHVVSDAEHART